METNYKRYEQALKRNLAETSNAILKRRALIGLHSAASAHGLDFFRVAAHALYNDILAHTMRVFDRGAQSAAFWYILHVEKTAAKVAIATHGVDISHVESISDRFKIIRDKTHFHIDRDALANPPAVWDDAGISGNELGYALESAFAVMSTLYYGRTGLRITVPNYDGSDVARIITAYKKCHPEVPIVI